jgi:hypothetical protein
VTYEVVSKGFKVGGFSSWERAAEEARRLVLNENRYDVSIREESK